MDLDCLKRDCKVICDIIELLAIVEYDLRQLNCKGVDSCHKKIVLHDDHMEHYSVKEQQGQCQLTDNTRKTLQEFYDLIQSTKSFFLTNDCGNVIGNKHITFCNDVYGYGIRVDIECQTIVVDIKTVTIDLCEYEKLPINRLLAPCFKLNQEKRDAFYQAVCCLKEYYKTLHTVCEDLTKHTKCCKY